MKFVKITSDNLECLKDFIAVIGSSSHCFRYYNSRDFLVTEDHIITLLLYDKKFVGYGHLDKEDNKVWLGICVKEGCFGKGYGKKIMEKLVNSYDEDIDLSVDADNSRAIQLYKLFDFIEINKDDDIIYMKRKANDNSN